MVETKNGERTAEQVFQRAEDAFSNMFENNRRTVQSVFEFQRNAFNSVWDFNRSLQEEFFRFADTWFEQASRFQKTYVKSVQETSTRVNEYTEKTTRENHDRFFDSLDQSIEMVVTAGKSKRR